MFLKQIVLHGFKSFADRTEFTFGPGMTGVVGPNGCGKSNILDALRWVLGEQSAKSLRGDRMLDVLFNGSRSRKPANFAEVSLTFDNQSRKLAADQDEVTIGRLLYRNGDSEYRINGHGCRLKDVRDLFLDTGVGVSAYSIIEQGRVDAILRANPLERRELFEEAAGISRYRARRLEAQRKLERTEQNLLRLNDVTEELERRVRGLKVAAGKARRYQEFDQRLRELRSAAAIAEYQLLSQQQRSGEEQVQDFEHLLAAQRVNVAVLEREVETLERAARGLEERLEVAEQEHGRLEREQATTAQRIERDELRVRELEAGCERETQQASEYAERSAELQERLATARQELDELRGIQTAADERAAQLEAQQRTARSAAEVARRAAEEARQASYEAARCAARLHTDELRQGEQIERSQALAARRQQRAGEIDTAVAQRVEALHQARAELESIAGQLAEAVAALDALHARLAELADQRRAVDGRLSAAKEQRSGLLSRLGVLEELERNLEGVGAGTRAVLEWRGGADDGTAVGLVADVLAIDDPRVTALQPLLARFENDLVVREAGAFFDTLTRRGPLPGPVHALALDRLPAGGDEQPADAPAAERVLDWVRCGDAYRDLARRLLGRVYLAADLGDALRLAGAHPAATFVTPDGRVIEAGGRLVVGGPSAAPGLIGRKSEIRQLREQLDEVEGQLGRLQRERDALEQAEADALLERGSLDGRRTTLERERGDRSTAALRIEDELSRLQREAELVAVELTELAGAIEQARARSAQLAAQRAEAEAEVGRCDARIAEQAGELERLTAVLAEMEQALTAARVEAGRAGERRQAREAVLRELQAQYDRMSAQRASAEREATQAGSRIREVAEDLARSREWLVRLGDLLGAQAAAVGALRSERARLRRGSDGGQRALRMVRGEVERVDQLGNAAQVALRETQVRLENLTTRIADELSLDLAALAAGGPAADQDWTAVRAEIEELRSRIARLGHVNLDAISELQEVEPRFDELMRQRADLVQSIEQLRALIVELDSESQARFIECYAEVREYFQELFRKLFGGGKADVILEDETRPLECGIEIIARPPGKEPQSISLLSGGEKTMAAVGLLFAIFKRKPSPFAILDEVDAALDDANIDRFNTMLVDFLTESQFIVITHSKRTMQRADVLYGITMEEPGVSKRVSVRFEDRGERPHVA